MLKLLTTLGDIWPVPAAMVAIALSFGHLEYASTDLAGRVSDVRIVQTEQSLRIDRIEESRVINLQRLAKSEEAISAMKETLAIINAKLDRVLMRR